MEITKIKLLRVLEILRETDENHPYTANQIVAKLALYGIEAEKKSVLRDIATLREVGYDILLHPDNKRGYFFASREFEDWELKVLMDAAVGASFLTAENARNLAEKLSSLSSRDGKKTLCAATPILSQVKAGDATTKNAIDLLLQAIRRKHQVSFQYLYTDRDLKRQLRYDGMHYQVNPYALVWRQDKYYLIGNYTKYQTLSYYRLDRIRSLMLTEEPALPLEQLLGQNADWKLRDFVNQNLLNYSGTTTRVKLAVDRSMMEIVEDAFGEQYELVSVNDTQAIISIIVSDGWGLNNWLLQHGDSVQILEPREVREAVVRLIEEVRSNYNSNSGMEN